MTRVFLRNDDVGDRTDALEAVDDILATAGLPCSHQVIPARLTDAGAAYLIGLVSGAPDRIVLHQHGYRHEQIIAGEHRWTEFAGGRPYSDQLADIRAGRRLMSDLLGDAFTATVFTPPSHKYDENTVRAVVEAGFGVLSAAFYVEPRAQLYYTLGRLTRRVTLLGHRVSHHGRTVPGTRLVEMSISVDLDRAASAPDPEGAVAVTRRQVAQAARRTGVVGLMMHHERFDSDQQRANLRAVAEWLATDPSIEMTTLDAAANAVLSRA